MNRTTLTVLVVLLATALPALGGSPCTAPVITQQPASTSACVGGTAVLTVSVTGPGPFTYQWYKHTIDFLSLPVITPLTDDAHRTGTQTPTLTINPAGPADAGGYTVHVSPVCNSSLVTGTQTRVLSVGQASINCPSSPFSTCFSGLGFLHNNTSGFPVPAPASRAFGISADGATVVGNASVDFETSDGSPQAFRWTRGDCAIECLNPLSQTSIWRAGARCASADGSILGGQSEDFPTEPSGVRWTGTTSVHDIGLPLPFGETQSSTTAVSADGAVMAGYSATSQEQRAWRWIAATGPVALDPTPGITQRSAATGISADGSIIVGVKSNQAMRWTSATGMVGIGFLAGGSINSQANAISGDGSVIVGFSSSSLAPNGEAFRWKANTMTGLGLLSGFTTSSANAVSANGNIIVGDCGGGVAFIWDSKSGMRNLQTVLTNNFGLNLTGWTLKSATGISADGKTIVGYGTNPNGRTEAWIASLGAISKAP